MVQMIQRLTYSSTGLVSATVDGVTINDTISGSLSRTSYGTLAGEQVGTYAINQNTVVVSDPTNYTTTYTSANLTITPAALGITADAQSKTYGTDDPSFTYSSTGLVSGTVDGVAINDTISGSLSRTSYGTLAGEQVGTYAINQNTVVVSDPTNYTTTYTSANLMITPAALGITADAQSKTYGTDDPSLTYTSTGLVSATVDGVAINDTISGSLSRTSYGTLAGEQVGAYAINQGSVVVSDPTNYTTTYTSANLTITPAALGITADAQSKTYGTDDPSLTYSSTGLVSTTVDGVAINDTISGSLSRTSYGTLAGEQVGAYAINQGSVVVSDPTNYTTTYTGANLTITKANFTVTADAQSKIYGVNDPTLTYTTTGLVDTTVDGVLIDDSNSLTGSLARDFIWYVSG